MGKTPWTPGPWFAELGHGIGNTDWTGTVPIDSNSWGSLARVMVTMDGDISEEGVANARLIAQSPRMAELLQEAVDLLDSGLIPESRRRESDEFVRDARAALAKARGEQ